jgi:hypothetical protein
MSLFPALASISLLDMCFNGSNEAWSFRDEDVQLSGSFRDEDVQLSGSFRGEGVQLSWSFRGEGACLSRGQAIQ